MLNFNQRPDSGRLHRYGPLILAVGAGACLALTRADMSMSAPIQLASTLTHQIQFSQPNTDEASDPQDRPQGGGSRRPCLSPFSQDQPPSSQQLFASKCDEIPLTAVVPQRSQLQSAWGQTVATIPTLWFYLPYPADQMDHLVFELRDRDGTLLIQDTLQPVSDTPGLMRYRPPLQAALAIGQTYRWHLLVSLDPHQPSSDAYITGRIKRIATPAALTQRSLNLLERAKILAAAGVWYDTVDHLARLSIQQPQYLRSLLQDVGLAHLAQAPVLHSVQQ